MNRTGTLARLRQSLLPLPALFGLAAIAASAVSSVVDRRIGFEGDLFPGGADSARSLLSSIASASLTLTAVVFSITMLVLQLTSAQYSPRVLRRFLRDRVSQTALAVFASTFIFSLAALRGVAPDAVPVTSVVIAFVLALLTIGVFVIYVNHIAQEIRVSSIIAAIADETREAIDDVCGGARSGPGTSHAWPEAAATTVVAAPHDGVVVAVNVPGLVSAAKRCDVAVELVPLVGDWVVDGAPLLRVIGDPPDHHETFTSKVSIGRERDMAQDPAYGMRQLIDIAERALSPGTNDPTTAVQAIQTVHGLLVRFACAPEPTETFCDPDGRPRFRRHLRSFGDLLDLAVDEILLYGQDSLQVTAALDAMLNDLLRVTTDARAELVSAKLEMVRRARTKLVSGKAWFVDGVVTNGSGRSHAGRGGTNDLR